MRFSAHVHFSDGRTPLRSPAPPAETLFAETPRKAALKLYWRLDDAARDACEQVTVGPFVRTTRAPYPIYDGPEVSFDPRSGFAEVAGKADA
jgi:hypothetical protein